MWVKEGPRRKKTFAKWQTKFECDNGAKCDCCHTKLKNDQSEEKDIAYMKINRKMNANTNTWKSREVLGREEA